MLRTALQPRWLVMLVVMLGLVFGFIQLGVWQWGQARDSSELTLLEQQASAPPVPLDEAIKPGEPFPDSGSGLPVITQGTYLPDLQFLVPERVLDGRSGWWVVVPLRTESGAVLPVLRGWVADPERAVAPPTGERTVTGTLAPGESTVAPTPLPDGERPAIDLATLVNEWPSPLYSAFIFTTDEVPPARTDGVEPVPPPSLRQEEVDWRNVGYGLQWWVFAGFAAYMYVRFLHQAAHLPRAQGPDQRQTVA